MLIGIPLLSRRGKWQIPITLLCSSKAWMRGMNSGKKRGKPPDFAALRLSVRSQSDPVISVSTGLSRGCATVIPNRQFDRDWVLGVPNRRTVSQGLKREAVSTYGFDECFDPNIVDLPREGK